MKTQPRIDAELFKHNRERLRQLLRPNSLAVVNANDVLPTNADGTLPLVPSRDLFYLSGVEQEETILLLCPDAEEESHREILFIRQPQEELKLWEGHKLSKEEASSLSGIKQVEWLESFPKLFHKLMCQVENVYLNSNEHPRAVITVQTREARFVHSTMAQYPLHSYHRLARLMHRLRVCKSPLEISLIQEACDITQAGFERVARLVQPGVTEREVEAEYAHEFIRRGARFAYSPIIASGKNSCVLHYIANDQPCRAGELLLLDVAASYRNYNSDLTRTIPVSGKFSRRQKQVYNAVLRVLRAQIAGLTPRKKHRQWQKEAEQHIENELLELGLITEKMIKKQDPAKPVLKKYFMHGVGHSLGLDVHDLGYMSEPFAPGWVLTVEPGIYIPEENFGVRLENNVMVSENGPVDLMAKIPIEADEIEALMNSKKRSKG